MHPQAPSRENSKTFASQPRHLPKSLAIRARRVTLGLALSAVGVVLSPAAQAQETFGLSTSSGSVLYSPYSINPVTIDSAITVTDQGGVTGFDGATVSIETGFVPSEDVLALPSPIGSITASYDSARGVLLLSGSDTAPNYQAALRSVTYQNTSGSPTLASRRIVFGLGSAVTFSGTGHFYEFVPAPPVSWYTAQSNADASHYLGLTGYLATITTAEENAFIKQKAAGNGWIGAYSGTLPATSSVGAYIDFPRTWYWATGPEAGKSFFFNSSARNGTSTGTDIPYANFDVGEPNNSDSEWCGEFYGVGADSDKIGKWNDYNGVGQSLGYFVEYGGMAGDPAETLMGSKTVDIASPTLLLTSSANPSQPGASVTFTAIIVPTPSEGQVHFTSSDSTLNVTPALSGNSTSTTTSALTTGTRTITAVATFKINGVNFSLSSTLSQVVSVSCPIGQTNCSGECVDLTRDERNCGSCGHGCASGEVCSGSTCAVSCVAGQTSCSGACTDLTRDNHNCGSCGHACASGEVCSGSTCAVSCVTGQTNCSGACADLTRDNHNCGTCGTVCPAGYVCNNRACSLSCGASQTPCGNDGGFYCATTTTDNHNCGACGHTCPAGQVCSAGSCAATCYNSTLCTPEPGEPYCAVVSNDNDNCGACGNVCPAGQVCSGGACGTTCAGEQTLCGDGDSVYCATTATDNGNCGACGNACASGQVCSGGVCRAACEGSTLCTADGSAPYCAVIATDNGNCGGCGNVCPAGFICSAGKCSSSCTAEQTLCVRDGSPYCASTATDNGNCGACGKTCPSGQVCSHGACGITCEGSTLCSFDGSAPYCAVVANDGKNCGACGHACSVGQVCSAGNCVAVSQGVDAAAPLSDAPSTSVPVADTSSGGCSCQITSGRAPSGMLTACAWMIGAVALVLRKRSRLRARKGAATDSKNV